MKRLTPPPIRAPLFVDKDKTAMSAAWIIWLSDIAKRNDWHEVDTFSGTWANTGAPYYNAAYHKDVFGTVRLRGRVGSGSTGTAAFTLPADFRPNGTQVFAVNGGAASIASSGVVTLTGTTLDLDNISFIAES